MNWLEASQEAVRRAASEGSLSLTWRAASTPSGSGGAKEVEESMIAWERVVKEGPEVFLKTLSGGDQEEVILSVARGVGLLSSVTKRNQSGYGITDWERGGRVMRRELQTGQN